MRKAKITMPLKSWQVKADPIRKLDPVRKDQAANTVSSHTEPRKYRFRLPF
ncbi:MAG: hypothetical protein ACYDCD_05510 [Candidatus Acidiferrales bacterium]